MATAAAPSYARDLSGKRLGRYEVLAQLAAGGMATVYVARSQGVAGFERLVAIKVLHPHLAHDEEFISMFLDEARLAARIRHPNVVPTLDISDTQGDGFFLVMEYVEGDHLGSLLREAARARSRLPTPVAIRIVLDSLEGLGAAHQLADPDGVPLGIVHRDISPHNIMVGVNGVGRITDFGVAKAEVRLSSTRDGQFKGKLSYMAPEQASNGQADQRSDLFSMGIVLWESLAGRRLFRAENNGELLNKLLNEDVTPPSEHNPEAQPFDAICLRALARRPEDRFQSAEEFAMALESVGAAAGGVATPRVVARSVREFLGEKLDSETARIRKSIDTLGRSEVGATAPRPSLESGDASQPSRGADSVTPSAIRPVTSEDFTVGARPSSISAVQPGLMPPASPSKAPWVIVGLLLLLLVGGGGAWMLSANGASETPAPEPDLAAAPVPAPPFPAPAPAAPVVAEEPAVPEPVVAAVPAEPEPEVEPTESESASARGSRGSRSGRRHRGSESETSTSTSTTTATAGSAGSSGSTSAGSSGSTPGAGAGSATGTRPPPAGGAPDDDLILNPYRR